MKKVSWEKREKKKVAIERIDTLFTLAEKVVKYSPDLARRYVELALEIQKKSKVKLPRKWKRRYCKRCHAFLVPGFNARVRLRTDRMPHVVITCLECGHIMRYPYLREVKEKRKRKKD
ncbi:ribonuclease P protein component 4 [Pyrococcus abyssi]|uniref:Ribonuclease P protein component 4 n=1 Tax=Pyrococcus abyssi (strain GE5 / Orsay) TaxID=272844 RepID=RNP4_PYRAB|nr:ribonuclease P protein component 4 [Pyrococcus abyssi]Q9V166.1 RecName: Full=Ribonuclease P protein component 4; Short=RNase P component 4; AltName: Full=Rpp21 [Pyrococcus abyssi GE5]CAB49484.1 RNAse P protein subunit RPR2 [Pyrococcus abyssi GE5]CCE69952.1 TPA: ribonuclease P protein component 4 [Pyrococcus abyssi GE5]